MPAHNQNHILRALIIGDSLGAPRPHRGQNLDSTWPVRLKTKYPQIDIWQRCRAGSMSDSVLKEYHLFSDSISDFDLLVIQVGIGDCCPRPYPLFLEKFIMAYGFRRLHKWLSSLYSTLLKFRSKPWISRREFAANLKQMIDTTRERNPRAKICVVKIGTPHGEFVRKVWNVREYAAAYNETMEELCRSYGPDSTVASIDPYLGFEPEELFISDGHHLTICGHRAVAQTLDPYFASLLNGQPEASSVTAKITGGASPQLDLPAKTITANAHSPCATS